MQQLMCKLPNAKFAATIVEDELKLVAPFLPINRHQESRTKRESGREQSRREERRESRVNAKGNSHAALCSSV